MHTTRTYIGVHLLCLRAAFVVSAIWLWLVQYEFAVSAIWHILLSNNMATGYKMYYYSYMQNLERYLEKTFKNQTFLLVSKMFCSTEKKIELKIPTDTQGYQIVTHMGSEVSRV